MPWVITRVALLTVITTFIAALISFLSGQWSMKGFTYNEIMSGGFLLAFGWLARLKPKTQLAIYTYWLPRSAGFASSEARPPHDFNELIRAYSWVVIYAISGLLTIGTGIGICMIYG